ncbi:serine protease [Halobacteriovorax sp. HLS]|uniref:serine protease n=1 Tax=Halobacteriovorax sp. HLS TaxID=2234000 RepID=UPI000FD716F5|nr:serine protease [Halobacteriovorax sp. HLS]
MMITSKKNGHKTLLVLLTLMTTLFISCGKQDQGPVGAMELFDSQIIIGDLDWKEITTLTSTNSIRKASSPVADITLPVMGSRCTGFLISEDVLMTNEHCIPSRDHAEGVTASFRHLKGVSPSDWETYECSTFLMNSAKYDFALLKCSGAPGRKFGFVKIDSVAKRQGTGIYIVQQNCDYYSERGCDFSKKYSKGSITKVEDEYTHNADTLGGSSGSPVFDSSTHKVVAIHHAGYGNNGMGRGYENYAVPMSKIVPTIKAKFPTLIGSSSSTGTNTTTDKTEPNDTISKAYTLSGKTQKLSGLKVSRTDDLDFFSINAKRGSKVDITVTFTHSKGDLDLFTVDSSGNVISKVESSSNNEGFSFVSTGSKAYFVIFGYKGAINSYDLAVTVKAPVSAPTSDNTMSTANLLSSSADFSESIDYKNDVDYYKFTVTKTTTIKAQLNFSNSKGDIELKLYSSAGKVLSSSTTTKDFESISKTVNEGTYYLKVYGYKGATNNYQMKFSK